MKPKCCKMILIEDGNMDYWWECDVCESRHKDTRTFEKSKVCPKCGAEIIDWEE